MVKIPPTMESVLAHLCPYYLIKDTLNYNKMQIEGRVLMFQIYTYFITVSIDNILLMNGCVNSLANGLLVVGFSKLL